MRLPVIAAVNGFALGGGCELALACDFIYASRKAKFGQPEVNLGVIPGFGGTQRLRARVGVGARARADLHRRLIGADEALRIGLVNAVFGPAELMPRVREVADEDRVQAPLAIAAAQATRAPGACASRRAARARRADRARAVRAAVRHRGSERGHERVPRQAPANSREVERHGFRAHRPSSGWSRRRRRTSPSSEIAAQGRRDRSQRTSSPRSSSRALGELGLLGMAVPEQWGGAGFDTVSYALAMEEISRACASTAVIMTVNNSLVCAIRQRRPTSRGGVGCPLASGKMLGCFALSEPEAGSDAAAQRTCARSADGDDWVINGIKNLITNGPSPTCASCSR